MASTSDEPAAAAAPPPVSQDDVTAPPPTTSVPGPRAQALQTAFARALDATLAKVSYDNFAECFPTTAGTRPNVLKDFHKSFVARLGEVCSDNVETIFLEREVVQALNALDGLIADAKERKEEAEKKAEKDGATKIDIPVPPHTLPPQALLASHLSPFLYEQHAHLNSSLRTAQDQNKALAAEIVNQKAEIEVLTASLEAMVKDLETAAEMVQDRELDASTAEVGKLESEIRPT